MFDDNAINCMFWSGFCPKFLRFHFDRIEHNSPTAHIHLIDVLYIVAQNNKLQICKLNAINFQIVLVLKPCMKQTVSTISTWH